MIHIGDLEWDEKPGRPAVSTRVYRCGPLRQGGAPAGVWLYAEGSETLPLEERAERAEKYRAVIRAASRAQRTKQARR